MPGDSERERGVRSASTGGRHQAQPMIYHPQPCDPEPWYERLFVALRRLLALLAALATLARAVSRC